MSNTLVIYHKACVDGWCSAWMMDRCLGGVDLLPAQYGDDPPVVDGRTVYVLDFSYPRDVMIEMHKQAHSFLVLDHHKTAEEACRGLDFCLFDLEQSGAGLTWWWLNDRGLIFDYGRNYGARDIASGMSPLSQYVQDRDLFKFCLDGSESVNAAIRSYPFELETWDYISKRMHVTPLAFIGEGEAIQRYRSQIVKQHVGHAKRICFDGMDVPGVLCSTGDIISDVAGEIAKGEEMGLTWCPTSEGMILFSLRSDPRGCDVGDIAKKYGGGGHKHAAGFKLPWRLLTGVSDDNGMQFVIDELHPDYPDHPSQDNETPSTEDASGEYLDRREVFFVPEERSQADESSLASEEAGRDSSSQAKRK